MDARSPGAGQVSPDDLDLLAGLSVFGALSRDAIHFLRRRCEEVEVRSGESFFFQGEMGDSLFILRSGRVAVERSSDGHNLVLAELGVGSFFGEMALLAIRPRNATVRALEDSSALKLRHLAQLELYERDPEQFTLLQMNLGREVARRLEIADRAVFEYARRLGETSGPSES